MIATIYDKLTGKIQMTVHSPDINGIEAQRSLNSNFEIYYDHDYSLADYYFENGKPKERPVMPIKFGKTELKPGEVFSISGIPQGATVIHPAGIEVVDDGFIEWVTDFPGDYKFTIALFPFKEVIIDAKVE